MPFITTKAVAKAECRLLRAECYLLNVAMARKIGGREATPIAKDATLLLAGFC
jgi:hypothetical protein